MQLVKGQDVPVSFEFVVKTASSCKVEIRSRIEGLPEKSQCTEGTMVNEDQAMSQMDAKPFSESRYRLTRRRIAPPCYAQILCKSLPLRKILATQIGTLRRPVNLSNCRF